MLSNYTMLSGNSVQNHGLEYHNPPDTDLNDEETATLRAAFDTFDKDGNGTINAYELGALMRSVGVALTKAELHEIFMTIDVNSNGSIDFSEYLAVMKKQMHDIQGRDSARREAFLKVFDNQNDDGLITTKELMHVMNKVLGENLSAEEVDLMMRFVDTKGEGYLTY